MSIVEFDGPPSWSPQIRSHEETKMAACRTQRSTSTISRKYRGLWTIYSASMLSKNATCLLITDLIANQSSRMAVFNIAYIRETFSANILAVSVHAAHKMYQPRKWKCPFQTCMYLRVMGKWKCTNRHSFFYGGLHCHKNNTVLNL